MMSSRIVIICELYCGGDKCMMMRSIQAVEVLDGCCILHMDISTGVGGS